MADITLIFNDKPIDVPAGLTILEVARRQGIEIPTLCHDDRMVPFGSCFVCIVEVVGARSFQPACATRVSPGMQIRTNSQSIRQVRKMALSLLLSNHYADCKAPCTLKCPAGVDVQGYIGLIANRQYREALALIKETNPFPLSIGRICTRPCEGVCRRGLVDEPLGIDYLKRFVADYDLNSDHPYLPEKKSSQFEKIAVIGAGPGGLSAAYYLAVEGYSVTVFEQHDHPGGMLRWGIPEYRLPKQVLDDEVSLIRQLGVEIHYNQALGRDFSLEDLKKRGYRVVLLAIGAQAGLGMRVKGEDLPGVMIGVDFLRSVVKGEIRQVGRRVAVIGGGNTAMDAARTSLRLGAEKVMIIYRRTREEIPANDIEIEEAIEEGIEFVYLTAPTEITGQSRAESIRCIRMELGEPDHSGRRRPVPVQGSEYSIPVDTVIAAIGQSVDLTSLSNDSHLPAITKWNTLQVNDQTMQTSIPWIFAVGDAVTGPQAAIDAIGGAGKAVKAILHYLKEGDPGLPQPEFIIRKDQFKPVTAEDLGEYPLLPRQKMKVLSPTKRKRNFQEIESGYTEKQALLEAERCLECGCQDLFECKLRHYAGEYQADISMFSGSYKKVDADNYHPYIRIEPNKCINCGRCVRICDEVQHLSVWGFIKRGFDTLIQPSFQEPLLLTECETCGQCVQTCPTGALGEKNPGLSKPGPFKTQSRFDICRYCSVGCGLEIHYTGNKIQRITGREDSRVNRGNLCFKGRFGYECRQDESAITTPWARKNGRLVPIGFDEAVKIIETGLNPSTSTQFVLGESLPQEIFRAIHAHDHSMFSFAEANYSPLIQSMEEAGLECYFGAPAAIWDSASSFVTLDADLQTCHPVMLLDIMNRLKNGRRLFSVQTDPDSKLAGFIKTGHVLAIDKPAIHILPGLNRVMARKNPSLSAELKSRYGSMSRSAVNPILDRLADQLLTGSDPVVLIVGRLDAVSSMHLANLIIMSGRNPEQLRIVQSGGRSNSAGWILEHQFRLPDLNLAVPPEWLITIRQDPIGCVRKGKTAIRDYYSKAGFRLTADVRLTPTAKASDLVWPVSLFSNPAGTYINSRLEPSVAETAGMGSSNQSDWTHPFRLVEVLLNRGGKDRISLEALSLADHLEIRPRSGRKSPQCLNHPVTGIMSHIRIEHQGDCLESIIRSKLPLS